MMIAVVVRQAPAAALTASAPDGGATAAADGGWFSRSFEENSILWLLIASTIGGIIGATVKFLFDDLASPLVSNRFQERRVFRSYLPGLLKDAESAEQRLSLLVRTVDLHWYDDDEYFRLYTLYQLGAFLARVHVIEVEVGFLAGGGSVRRSRHRFNDHLYGPFNGLTSFRPFKDDYTIDDLDRSQVPRGMLKAIGEAMTGTGDSRRPIDFTEFVDRFGHAEFERWFHELDELLRRQGPDQGSRWDRVIVTAAEFRILARRLDPKGKLVGLRQPANLNRLNSTAARDYVVERWRATTREPIGSEPEDPLTVVAP